MKLLQTAILFFAFWISTLAQEGTIKGIIKDAETKEPMIGVNILSENGTGTVTDLDGKYELKVPAGQSQIEYKFIGYSTNNKKVRVEEGETIILDLNMFQESLNLGLVVVSSSKYEKKIDEEVKGLKKVSTDGGSITANLRAIIKSVDGDSSPTTIWKFVDGLLVKDSRYIRAEYAKRLPDVNFNVQVTCDCSDTSIDVRLPIGTDFFWPDSRV
jgi:hypothetical protein